MRQTYVVCYDVCDPTSLNPALGGEQGFAALAAGLRARSMGLLLDTVPNHMGIGDERNAWWMDVLENGPSSAYAPYFDIEWQPVKRELENKVLLPILEDQYGRVLESGRLRLACEDGTFYIYHNATRLPVAPRTYCKILEQQLGALVERVDEDDGQVLEYQSILTALRYLPPRTERDPAKLAERNREKEVIKRRIDALYRSSAPVRTAIDDAVRAFNGDPGDPSSFDRLDDLMEAQSYRLAFWRVAAEEINYRRFFDVNDLAAIRTEDPEVFKATHELVFRLLSEGSVTGLRIDHIDGLQDPHAYLRRLQEGYVLGQVRARLAPLRDDLPEETLAARVSARIAAAIGQRGTAGIDESVRWPLYVVVEKILGEGEHLPVCWPTAGTTGYDFLNVVGGLFVDGSRRGEIDRLYRDFADVRTSFANLTNSTRKMTMLVSLASELYSLSHQLERIAERNRRYRDFTLDTLTFGLREVIAALPVYRTYIASPEADQCSPGGGAGSNGSGPAGPEGTGHCDEKYVEAAVAEARRRNPRTASALFDFIRDAMLLRNLKDLRPQDQEQLVGWVRKLQQLTGPVMAKGVEDTAFYVYNRLVSLNEVGGNPERFGVSVAAFHEHNEAARRSWPHTLLATSTHDTKRSEDVRARIHALSEMPDEWARALGRWSGLNASLKATLGDALAPDRNDEFLLYQTLVGAWPFELLGPSAEWPEAARWESFRQRIASYMEKATREAKVHTSWVNPNGAYDAAVRDFVLGVLDPTRSGPFLDDIRAFARRVAHFGKLNSLSQVLLKLTSPGVPDLYQGTELWDLSLVDPDNRHEVDYDRRRSLLAGMRERLAKDGDPTALVEELLDTSADGRIKLYLTWRVLELRRRHPDLFAEGDYQPVEVSCERQQHVCAFTRTLGNEMVLVVAPRLVVGLSDGDDQCLPLGESAWHSTWLAVPGVTVGQRLRDWLTGREVEVVEIEGKPGLRLADACASFPVALLETT